MQYIRVKAGVHVDTGQTVAIKILRRQDIIESGMTEHVKNEVPEMTKCIDVEGQMSDIIKTVDSNHEAGESQEYREYGGRHGYEVADIHCS
jgi:hypothetical protein